MDGNDLLVLEFLALVICATVLILISGKFKPLVIITSASELGPYSHSVWP